MAIPRVLCDALEQQTLVVSCTGLQILHRQSSKVHTLHQLRYSEQAVLRERPSENGVVCRRIDFRRWRLHLAPKHDVLRSTVVLRGCCQGPPGTTFRSPGPAYFKEGRPGCSALGCIPIQEAHQHSWNSTSRVCVPRGTGAPHKGHGTNDRDVNKEDEEDGVEQRMP